MLALPMARRRRVDVIITCLGDEIDNFWPMGKSAVSE